MIESIEKGRQEDGNRSIADKIIKRLHDLNKTVENNQGRWAWELLQNAKDSIADDNDERKVSVQIELSENKVEFKHNGIHFTEKDIRGLINQISSKEIEDGETTKKTGRFGTGFLTTHLLSKIIQIKGIVKTIDNDFYSFNFNLNRNGKTTSELTPKIDSAWKEFHSSAVKISPSYNLNAFNTSFTYNLDSEPQRKIAQIGIEEFIKLIPYVMSFISKIGSVEIVNDIDNKRIHFENNNGQIEEYITKIAKTENGKTTHISILNNSNEKVSISCEVEKTNEGYSIKSIDDLPKIFCDFPLIGTEDFNFPIIVNSFYFNPQRERDGIWLKGSEDDEVIENQNLLLDALSLYKNLITNISDKNYFDFFNIIETKMPKFNDKYFDDVWYKKSIQSPLRDYVTSLNIVELENGKKKAINDLWFPSKSYSDSIKEKLWKYNYDLIPELVCKESHLIEWSKKSWGEWNNLDYEELAKDIEGKKNINTLSEYIKKEYNETYDWLNTVSKFLLEQETNKSLFENYAITPNQNEDFKKKDELYIDKIKDNRLIQILKLLGDDWKEILINKNVNFGRYKIKEKKDISVKITRNINNSSEKNGDYNKAIILLSEWFENNNPDDVKNLFSELHRKRAELFMNTISDKDSLYKIMKSTTDISQLSKVAIAMEDNPELIKNIENSKELNDILREYSLGDVSELKQILDSSMNSVNIPKLDLTQEYLAGLGVTTIEELEEALKDKDLANLFHNSKPNTSAFLYAEKLILRAKQNIIEHIKTLDKYDCSELEELSTTVIGGIKKNGLLMHIVVRPSDNNQVIIYYGSEKDTLDYANAELWIENGVDKPKCLTLGKILKNTGINKIPV